MWVSRTCCNRGVLVANGGGQKEEAALIEGELKEL